MTETVRTSLAYGDWVRVMGSFSSGDLLPHECVDVGERVYVKLEGRTFYGCDDGSEMPVSEFIEYLNSLAAEAPVGSNVIIKFDTESDYDGPSSPSYEVGYWRDPSDEEKSERIALNGRIRARDEKNKQMAAEKERALYESLKAKFASDSDTRPKDGDAKLGSTRE